MNDEHKDLGKQIVAITAMLVVIIAAVALGTSQPASGSATSDATAWLQQIESGGDHIEPHELASELLRTPRDVVVVDLRPAAEFAGWHLPGALNLTVPDLCGAAGAALFATQPRLVVLCSDGPAHPGQAWLELQHQGQAGVKVLAGGLTEFKARMLTPPSLREGASEAVAMAASADYLRLRDLLRGTTPDPNSK